jgi:hypothetical protein
MVSVCGAWLVGSWLIDRLHQRTPPLTPLEGSQ